jgi:hypothetical protein
VTTASAGQGVILSTNAAGTERTVWNASAVDLLFYPPSGAQIEANGTNTAITVTAGGSATVIMNSTTQAYAR